MTIEQIEIHIKNSSEEVTWIRLEMNTKVVVNSEHCGVVVIPLRRGDWVIKDIELSNGTWDVLYRQMR